MRAYDKSNKDNGRNTESTANALQNTRCTECMLIISACGLTVAEHTLENAMKLIKKEGMKI